MNVGVSLLNGSEIALQRQYVPKALIPYFPFIPPSQQPGSRFERPHVSHVAPFPFETQKINVPVPTPPDDFIEASGSEAKIFFDINQGPVAINSSEKRNFGGVLEVCKQGISDMISCFKHEQPIPQLPNYNMDSDRGFACATWDVNPPVQWQEDKADEALAALTDDAYKQLFTVPEYCQITPDFIDPFDYGNRCSSHQANLSNVKDI